VGIFFKGLQTEEFWDIAQILGSEMEG